MLKSLLLASLVAATACAHSRSQPVYAADTTALLETKSGELQACYNEALKTEPTAAGVVTVKFTVEPTSGLIKDATIDPTKTTAPESLDKCVLTAMNGLTLTPSDRNEGLATFTYEFKANPPPPPADAAPTQATSG